MPNLLIVSSAPAAVADDGVFLDRKFVEGMKLYSDTWNGRVGCILKKQNAGFPFGQHYCPEKLDFDINIVPMGHEIDTGDVDGYDLILLCGDSYDQLGAADICRKLGKQFVYTIEYTIRTRRQIIFLERDKSIMRKVYSLFWMYGTELRRVRAFRMAAGIQANGFPAMRAYGAINMHSMMYFDSRIDGQLLATEREMSTRRKRMRAGEPVRLIYSGRLETLKGAQDLVPIAAHLHAKGVKFELNIFGFGSLAGEIRQSISNAGLEGLVRLHGPVDFETELVPFSRGHADIFVSCHRQSDPSCTYIESMGCGLPIAGYANEMWQGLQQASGGGWIAPLGDWKALADEIATIANQPEEIDSKALRALSFASEHGFRAEFQRRVDHLNLVVQSND